MIGYGDPSINGLGYGDPTPPTSPYPQELGYGDPTRQIIIEVDSSSRNLPHLGGAPIFLRGIIPEENGPYRVKALIGSEQVFLYGGQAGKKYDITPNRNELICFSPPAPAGSYNLVILYGPHFTDSLTITNGLNIKPAMRNNLGYATKALYPRFYTTGPKNNEQQELDTASTAPNQRGPLELLIDSFAFQAQSIAGRLQTATTAETPPGQTLIQAESALGLPSTGSVYIANKKYTYTLENENLRLNTAPLKTIPEKEPVYHVIE